MWKVTATLQAKGNEPVEMVWQKNGDELGAVMCVTQLFRHENDKDDSSIPFPELLAIKIERVGE